jgi:hypothetical protein
MEVFLTAHRNIASESASMYRRRAILLSIPILVLESIAAFLSSMGTIGAVPGYALVWLQVLVSFILTINIILHSIHATLNYESRYEVFSIAAEQYDMLLIRVRFESRFPDEVEFVSKLERKLLKIRSMCKFTPPDHIRERYRKTITRASFTNL